ncbi:MAG TPA: sulfatase-like hydrolase/transferase [Bacillota bacterium]|nr:sulfatase-like hydrolase/transferase [Bacillota bacterium]
MSKIKTFYRKYLHNVIAAVILLAIVTNLIIETLARQSIWGGFLFFVQSPLIFLYNSLLIFATISLGFLFKRRAAAFVTISFIWIILGIVNGIILSKRMTPFTVYDILSFKEGLSIVGNYFSVLQMVLIAAGIAFVVALFVFLRRKIPKHGKHANHKRRFAVVAVIILITFGVSGLFIRTGIIETYFPNLAYGFRDNGFPYCFINTWFNTGIGKPKDYSKENVRSIFTKKEMETTVAAKGSDGNESHPNILFLQMEAFMDPETVKGLRLSEDAIPTFRKLMKKNSSGRFLSPAVGAGTANVEFEVMTGMSVRFFGPGEYPHKSLLGETVCESVAYDLKNIGYFTHAIHNHRATFYGRNQVFANLGFDTFTSVEYMNKVNRTPKNWAKDYVLTQQVTDALKATKGPDYIYTISVEGHGAYPEEKVLEDPGITVERSPSEETKYAWEYYVNQLNEMDEFIDELIKKLKVYDEDIVLVIYGDHLPNLPDISDEKLKYGRNTYETDYVIWSNFQMKQKNQDLKAYDISAALLDRLGIKQGTMVTYHQNHKNSRDYQKNLEILQYDMLYGEQYIYNGKNPFNTTEMKMGVKDIKINKVVKIGEKYYIKGKNFTESSRISLNGKILKTIYLGSTVLGLQEEVDPTDVSKMKVSQFDKEDKEILSTTE